MVIWIIGLSGSGKTTITDKVYNEVSSKVKNIVKIDGDVIREMFSYDLGHSIEDRKKNAHRISKLCQFLENQNMIVICSILSAFEYDRQWNRENIKNYYEIYIRTSKDVLIKRDSKNIYGRFLKGKINNVVGFDIPFEEPIEPNLLIENNNNIEEFLKYSNVITKFILENDV